MPIEVTTQDRIFTAVKQFTERQRDDLCDIAWWLKGYKAGADNTFENCPFSHDHLKTLEQVCQIMREILNQTEK